MVWGFTVGQRNKKKTNRKVLPLGIDPLISLELKSLYGIDEKRGKTEFNSRQSTEKFEFALNLIENQKKFLKTLG